MPSRPVWIVAALLLSGCGGSSSPPGNSDPLGPTPLQGSVPTPAPPFSLSGVVRAGAVLVPGATVALLTGNTMSASTLTDPQGTYGFSGVQNVSFSGALIGVSKPGYFTDTKYIFITMSPQTLDFDLEAASIVPVGQRVRTPTGGARCASLGYGGMGGSQCRRSTVIAPATGQIDVTVTSIPASPFDITILRPDGTIAAYRSDTAPVGVTADVIGSMPYQIDVVHIDPSVREFELTTTSR